MGDTVFTKASDVSLWLDIYGGEVGRRVVELIYYDSLDPKASLFFREDFDSEIRLRGDKIRCSLFSTQSP